MGRILKLTDQGEARFYEGIAGGTSKISLKAPATLAADFSLTLPSALPGSTEFLTLSATGVIATASGASTLQQAYDNGPNIVLDTDPIGLSQANNNSVITIAKTGAGAGILIDMDNDGTGKAVYLKQDGLTAAGGSVHLECTVNNTGAPVLTVDKTASGGGNLVQISNSGTGDSLRIANTANGGAVSITKTASGAGTLLNLDNDGTGTTLNIDNSANAPGIVVLKTGTGAGDAVSISNQGSGRCLFLDQSVTNANALRVDSNRNFTNIQVNKSGTGAGSGIAIADLGTGASLDITKGGNGIAINIAKSASGAGACIAVDNDGTGVGVTVQQDGAGSALVIVQNGGATASSFSQTTNNRLLFINKTGTGAGIAVEIDNDGTAAGLHLNQDGAASAMTVDMDSALTVAAIAITHNGADAVQDIQGTSDTWHITRRGEIKGGRFAMGQANHTISGGVVTLAGGGYLNIDTEAAAASDDLDTITSTSQDPVTAGTIIIITAANDARTVVLKNGTGNLELNGGADRSLTSADDTVMLLYNGTKWLEVGFSDNSA